MMISHDNKQTGNGHTSCLKMENMYLIDLLCTFTCSTLLKATLRLSNAALLKH